MYEFLRALNVIVYQFFIVLVLISKINAETLYTKSSYMERQQHYESFMLVYGVGIVFGDVGP